MTTLEFEGMPTFTLAFDRVAGGSGSSDWIMATEAEALAGTSNTVVMSPLRVDQAVDQAIAVNNAALGPIVEDEVNNVLTTALVQGKLYFFDKAGDLLAVTIPVGVDVIYRLGYVQRGDHDITRFRRKADAPTTAPTNNLAWEKDSSGVYFVNDMPEIDARTLGFKGGARIVSTAGMTASSTTLGATGANFTSADVGKKIWATGFGTLDTFYNNDSQFDATIVSVSNVNNCVLDTPAVTTASGQYCVIGWDDTIPLANACRAAATLLRWASAPSGDFVTTGSVTGPVGYSFFRLHGAGVAATRIISAALGSASTAGPQFQVVGGLVPLTYMTAPAAIGTNTIVLNSVTGLAAGNVVVLAAEDQPQLGYEADKNDALATSVWGDVNRIRSIDVPSKTVLLESALIYSYTANPTIGLQSTVARVDVPLEPSLKDMCLEHVSTSANGAVTHVSFTRALRPRVENILFRHTGGQCMAVGSWIDGIANNINFSFVGGQDALDSEWGYGFNIVGFCWNVVISNIVAWRCRHGLTSGGGHPYPGPHFVHVSQFLSYGCRINFDTHPGGRYWTFEDCHTGPGAVLLNVPTPGSFGVGFQMRTFDTKLIGCTAAGSQVGFSAAYTQNCIFENCHTERIDTGWNIISSPGTELINCTVRDYAVQGIKAYRQSNVLNTMPNLRFKGVTLYGNPTKQELLDDQTYNPEPAAFALGYWDSTPYPPGNFISHYEDSWIFEDITIYDAKRRWYGLPETGVVYGALKQNTVIAESVPLDDLNGTASLASGTMLMAAIDIPKGTWVTKLGTIFAAAPVGQTNLWFSIWDWNLNFLGVTTDALAVAPSISVLTMLDVATPFAVNHPGRHYIGITQVAGTPSTINSKTLAAALISLNPKRAGTSNTGLTTPAALPSISAATSATSLPVSLGTMEFVTQAGKAFTISMPILIASNATPANFMRARVTLYAGTTLNVDVYETGGSGTFNDWNITARAKATALTATAGWAYVAVGN